MPTVEVSATGGVLVDAAGADVTSGAGDEGAALRKPKTTRAMLAISTAKFTQESFFMQEFRSIPTFGSL